MALGGEGSVLAASPAHGECFLFVVSGSALASVTCPYCPFLVVIPLPVVGGFDRFCYSGLQASLQPEDGHDLASLLSI